MAKGQTHYSDEIPGAKQNYNFSVTFDLTDGFLGIVQKDAGVVKDRVLLSPEQVEELTKFLGAQ
jgi:hypothetical protein